ncbi:hypothetical protein [Paracoccus sp. C2R09]|nr:hypothetical protein [Paracoccus sp. C2R09]MBU2959085.1 hypothetical protein [Paracoccus sp. C2R09]
MTQTSLLDGRPLEFEGFLYASLGEDSNGFSVTVLSGLARLGLDPWDEVAALVRMDSAAAHARLNALLSRMWDVPGLARNHDKIVDDLTLLLPPCTSLGNLKQAATAVTDVSPGIMAAVWAVLMIVLVILQLLLAGSLDFIE